MSRMEELGRLLQSQNRETRARAIKIFHSRFLADPAQVIDNFSVFLPYYRSLLENRRTASVAFYEETEELVRCIVTSQAKVTAKSATDVLAYFLECLRASPQNCRVDAFVAHILDNSQIVQAVLVIFKSVPAAEHVGLLFKFVAASQNESLLDLIKSKSKELAALMSANPDDFLESIVAGIQSASKSIQDFTLSALVIALTSKELTVLLVPYMSYIQAMAVQKRITSMQQVYQMLRSYMDKENVAPEPIQRAYTPLARIKLEAARFAVEQDDTGKRRPPAVQKAGTAVSLSKTLEEPMVAVELVDETQPQSPQQAKQSIQRAMTITSKKEQVQEVLSTSAHKLGGFQHGTWQQRQFQFFPNNKCLLWRAKKSMNEIKGLVLLEQNVTIEKVPKGLKGKQFVIQIKLPKKVHEIAFAGQEELDKWMDAMLACINSGK